MPNCLVDNVVQYLVATPMLDTSLINPLQNSHSLSRNLTPPGNIINFRTGQFADSEFKQHGHFLQRSNKLILVCDLHTFNR